MSVITCICSDSPLPEYPERSTSISEELQHMELPEGIRFIPAPAAAFEADAWEDQTPDDYENLAIFCADVRALEIATEKRYCVIVQWDFDASCAERLIRYMNAQLQNTSEIELWHFWSDGDFSHRSKTVERPIAQITPEQLAQMEALPVWNRPLTNYCCRIIRS